MFGRIYSDKELLSNPHISATSRIRAWDTLWISVYTALVIFPLSPASSISMNGVIRPVCILSRNENVAHLVEELKRNSSRWIKTLSPRYHHFAWQGGFAAYSMSQSVIEKAIEYVSNQREHHKKMSFHDEYLRFLKLYNVDYDERYIFSDWAFALSGRKLRIPFTQGDALG